MESLSALRLKGTFSCAEKSISVVSVFIALSFRRWYLHKSIKLYPFMKKDFIQNAGARYESPECSVIAFGFEGVLCGSGRDSWGLSNQAGDSVEEDEYSTLF